ncbi:MAG: hypothetical protein K2P81_09730 [Bacteriovoracaceae bacterium]|nr:hypothetical protein [Bacteriovoracaceae bacterium]
MTKLTDVGIAPNLLLKDVETTAPFLFRGELNTSTPQTAYLAKLIHYKKNLKLLKTIDLFEYFSICMSAHWATAGTFVPTNVDNQIREGLWKHSQIQKFLDKMARLTIESWTWDYSQVTNRKSFNPKNGQVMSTHEGTWLSVAIGAYCALVKYKSPLQKEMSEVILAEIEKEEKLLQELRQNRDFENFLRSSALMAHNFGDLDRVIDQWLMPLDDPFRKRIYKLGHELNPNYSKVLAFAGQVNKKFLSVENHRHMSMRQPKCLRQSHHFLVPVGPFMEKWGETLAGSQLLSKADLGEIVAALFDGYNRQNLAMGYARCFGGMMRMLPKGLESLEMDIPFDLALEIKKSKFFEISEISDGDFRAMYKKHLEEFICPVTQEQF